jgi:HSP20 family protein
MFFAPAASPFRSRGYTPAARAFDRSFERFLSEAFAAPAKRPLRVQQDAKAWTLSLDLPGVAREELTIDVEGAVVRIATKDEAKRPFKAAYELPEEIDAGATSAKLENGVLTLVVGKKQPVATARRVEIR